MRVRGNVTGAHTGGPRVAHRDQPSVTVDRDSGDGADRDGHGTDPAPGPIVAGSKTACTLNGPR